MIVEVIDTSEKTLHLVFGFHKAPMSSIAHRQKNASTTDDKRHTCDVFFRRSFSLRVTLLACGSRPAYIYIPTCIYASILNYIFYLTIYPHVSLFTHLITSTKRMQHANTRKPKDHSGIKSVNLLQAKNFPKVIIRTK
jgi:hypothetical protein